MHHAYDHTRFIHSALVTHEINLGIINSHLTPEHRSGKYRIGASTREDVKHPPPELSGVYDPSWGSPAEYFSKILNLTENCCSPRSTSKKSLLLNS